MNETQPPAGAVRGMVITSTDTAALERAQQLAAPPWILASWATISTPAGLAAVMERGPSSLIISSMPGEISAWYALKQLIGRSSWVLVRPGRPALRCAPVPLVILAEHVPLEVRECARFCVMPAGRPS